MDNDVAIAFSEAAQGALLALAPNVTPSTRLKVVTIDITVVAAYVSFYDAIWDEFDSAPTWDIFIATESWNTGPGIMVTTKWHIPIMCENW